MFLSVFEISFVAFTTGYPKDAVAMLPVVLKLAFVAVAIAKS